ncbi:MAG TPA: hypothetical protein ENI87_11130, partial [bacterium]|nr:hypothetical protein [bacterium]
MNRDRRLLLVGALLLAALGTFVALRIRVATDITHFLPAGADARDVLLARELATGELSRTIVLLVDAPDASTAAAANRDFEGELRARPAAMRHVARLVGGADDAIEDAMWQTYERHGLAFLAPDRDAARARLADDALDRAIATLKRKLSTDMSTLLGKIAPADPLLVLPRLFERVMGARGGGLRLVDGRFLTQDERGGVLFLTTRAATSNATALRPLMRELDAAFRAVARRIDAPLALQQSGAHLFALAAEASIRADIQRVSIGSAVGLTLLFVLLFRSLRLLLLVLPILASGFLAGTSVCLWWFGSVHGLTLAFGAALIGVSVDYGVHFHCHHLHAGRDRPARATLRAVWPGLSLGALTTITGFVALIASGFPGLRQLAVFAVSGIAAAALSTQLFLPGLAAPGSRPTKLAMRLAAGLRRLWFAPHRSRTALLAPLVAVALVIAVGLPRLRWNDGIAGLNRIDPEVAAKDAAVRGRVVRFEQGRLVVATGADEEQALQANERIAAALEELRARGALAGFRSLAPMLPSRATQAAVVSVQRDDPTLWPRLARSLERHQFRPAAFEPFHQRLVEPPPAPLTYDQLAASALAPLVEPFRFTWSGGTGFVTLLRDLHDEAAVRAALAAIPGADLIDIAGSLSGAYGAYRERLLRLWLVGLGGVLLLVWLRHRRLVPTLIAWVPA